MNFKKNISQLSKKSGFTLQNFSQKNLGGFTVLELVVFTAIFALVAVAFVAILISVVRIQTHESAAAEVNRQSQFLMHIIQRYVEESSMIDIADADLGTATSTLTLRMTSSSDTNWPYPAQVFIYASGTQVYLKEGQGGAPQPLTSDLVKVDRLEFKKQAHPDAHDSVDVILAVSYNTENLQRKFSQLIQTAVARVSAATFDSDVIPSSTSATLNVGVIGKPWKSVNQSIYFTDNAGNISVGIGASPSAVYGLDVNTAGDKPVRFNNPTFFTGNCGASGCGVGIGTTTAVGKHQLTVSGDGGLFLQPTTPKPICDSGHRGLIWFEQGLSDYLRVCMQAFGSLQWVNLYATTTAF